MTKDAKESSVASTSTVKVMFQVLSDSGEDCAAGFDFLGKIKNDKNDLVSLEVWPEAAQQMMQVDKKAGRPKRFE